MNETTCAGASAVQSFDAMYIKLRDPFERMISYQFGVKEEAKDILQELFIKLWQHWGRLQWLGEQEIKDYAFRAVRNQIINYNIQRSRPKYDKAKFTVEYSRVNNGKCWDEEMLVKEGIMQYRKAVNRLPKKEKIVYVLYLQGDLTLREIAGRLNKSQRTVHNQLTSADKAVKCYLRKNYDWNLRNGRGNYVKEVVALN